MVTNRTQRSVLVGLATLLVLGPPVLYKAGLGDAGVAVNPSGLDPLYFLHAAVWTTAAVLAFFYLATYVPGGVLGRYFLDSCLAPYCFFALVAVASVVYSVNPTYTLYHALKLPVSIMFVAMLIFLLRLQSRELLDIIYLANAIGWVCVAVVFVLLPSYAGQSSSTSGYRLIGRPFNDYGIFAAVMGTGILCKCIYHHMRWQAAWVLYPISFAFVVLSRTRMTIGICMVIFLLSFLLHRRRGAWLGGLVIALVILGVVAGSQSSENVMTYLLRDASTSELQDMNGRVNAFNYLLDKWAVHPLLGYGFEAGNRYHMLRYAQTSGIQLGSAHDALSKALIDLGLVGTVLLGFAFLAVGFTAVRSVYMTRRARDRSTSDYGIAVQYLLLFILYIMTGFTGAGVAGVSVPLIFIFSGISLQQRELAGMRKAPPRLRRMRPPGRRS